MVLGLQEEGKGGLGASNSGYEGRVGVVHSWCDSWAQDIRSLVSKVALSMNFLELSKLAGSDSLNTCSQVGVAPGVLVECGTRACVKSDMQWDANHGFVCVDCGVDQSSTRMKCGA